MDLKEKLTIPVLGLASILMGCQAWPEGQEPRDYDVSHCESYQKQRYHKHHGHRKHKTLIKRGYNEAPSKKKVTIENINTRYKQVNERKVHTQIKTTRETKTEVYERKGPWKKVDVKHSYEKSKK